MDKLKYGDNLINDVFLNFSLPSWLEARREVHEARPYRQQGILQGCPVSTMRRCMAVDQFHHFFATILSLKSIFM